MFKYKYNFQIIQIITMYSTHRWYRLSRLLPFLCFFTNQIFFLICIFKSYFKKLTAQTNFKGRKTNFVRNASKKSQKIKKLDFFIKKFFKIKMNKIRLPLTQKWIKMQKKLVASLLFFNFKAKEFKMFLLLCCSI